MGFRVSFYTLTTIISSLNLLCYCNGILLCPDIEKQALITFKESLDDPFDYLSSWDSEVDCCSWRGVACDNSTGHIYQLHLVSDYGWVGGRMNPSLLNLKHLRHLDLSGTDFEGTIPSFIGSFKGLEYLNLSESRFSGTIPHSIGNLSSLRTLSLSLSSGLSVDNLKWLSGLSQLQHLDMGYVNLSRASNSWLEVINTIPSLVELYLTSCDLSSVGNLNYVNLTSSLAVLDLQGNGIRSFSVPGWVFQLDNLVYLDISNNYFEGPIPQFSNATKLRYLELSSNNFNSTIPDWLYSCTHLDYISLQSNVLHGVVSNAITNLTSLTTLYLSYNMLAGEIPAGITEMCRLRSLDLSNNMFLGDVHVSFGNMSDCFLASLEGLSMRGNRLSGYLTDQFVKFRRLSGLDLGQNLITGTIPFDIGGVSTLEYLTLSNNRLSGDLPRSIGQLHNLKSLDIQGNMLEGVVTQIHFVNLTELIRLYASGNHLTLRVDDNWVPPFKLASLKLGSWDLGGGAIPSWLQTQKPYELDLSRTGIAGSIPRWLSGIRFLDLSYNQLHGEIPYFSSPDVEDPSFIYLSSNKFNGSLPRVSDTVAELDLSNNSFSGGITNFMCDNTTNRDGTAILLLGGNQLTGELPDCLVRWRFLTVLNLGDNNMSGSIPSSIRHLGKLTSLNLRNNNFSGRIPFSMKNCTSLVKIDLSGNNFSGPIPEWIGTSLIDLIVLILHSNEFGGDIPSSICHLTSLKIFDLSSNNISGVIPKCINNFTAMASKTSLTNRHGDLYTNRDFFQSFYVGAFVESAVVTTKGRELEYGSLLSLVTNIDLSCNDLSGGILRELTSLVELRSLNLSENRLEGSIPKEIGDMKQLESLDLSWNYLSGEIPDSFKVLSSLNYLNLSYNNLSGRIPESTQISIMDASGFVGNKLCGPPLTRRCSRDDDDVPSPTLRDEETEDGQNDVLLFGVFLSAGYVAGLFTFCAVLIINKQWREAYYKALEDLWNKVCVWISIRTNKLSQE